MSEIKKLKRIEWICTTCGRKESRFETNGRPTPGTCPKKADKSAHRWVKNRVM